MVFGFFRKFRKKTHEVDRVQYLAAMTNFIDQAEAMAGIKHGDPEPFYVILIEGELMKVGHSLLAEFSSSLSSTDDCLKIQKDGKGAVIVTTKDPLEIVTRYKSSGVKFVAAFDGKPHPNPDNRPSALRLSSDLIIYDEYNELCRANGLKGGVL